MTLRSPLVATVVATLALAAAELAATEVKIFRIDSHEDFAAGDLEGVSVHPHGTLQLARRLGRVAALEEPFVFSAAAHGDGWVIGTGNAGKVMAVSADGAVRELFTAEEPEIFAVLGGGPGGDVYAASSPAGKVYRIAADGTATVVFDPEEQYVWALAHDPRGGLLVATGLAGRVYRVTPDGGAELLADVGDSHVRALAVAADGGVLLGTAGQGKVLRLGPDGRLETLHDSLLAEVLAFAPRPDGGAWAAVLASEASLLDLSATAPAEGEGEPTVTVVVEQGTVGSRGGGATGPRSVLLDVAADGAVREVETFDDVTVHSLALAAGGELWLGTGEEGELYRRDGDHLVLEHDLEERQVPALVPGPGGLAAVTTNAAAVYRLTGEVEAAGTFTSAVLDAEQPAQFGSFVWDGSAPRGTDVELSFRSGMSEQPDATWTDWTAAAEGRSASLGELSDGRFVQWRARLVGRGAATPRLRSAELSYKQRNQAPEITTFEVLDPGQILVPTNFNPASQTFEPWSPNREGIFTTLKSAPTSDEGRVKELWKKGFRTLTWEAEDPNGDELIYDLAFRREADLDDDAAEEQDPEAGWLAMAEGIEDTWYSFDATVLPDGRYRFRLTASDRRGQPAESARSGESLSEETVIDNTAPQLLSARRRGDTLEVELADALSPLREAVVSADAGEWRAAVAADGLLDGRREVLTVAAPPAGRLLLLRVTDAAFNVVTFDLLAATR